MNSVALRYVLITPARNEAANLERLAACVIAQTRAPAAWVIVDDGSDDGTAEFARSLTSGHAWISLTSPPPVDGGLKEGRRSGRDVAAFMAGVETLDDAPDVVVKLDADVSFDADFFPRLMQSFREDPRLGIAGGLCYEQEEGLWVARHTTGTHVRGATRAYRWRCFRDVLPLEPRLGWDGIDALRAELHGWTTRTIADLPFRHHRPVGQRDGALSAFASMGEAAHYMGYRSSYLLARALYRARRDPAAVAMVWGYSTAALRLRPRLPDADVRRALRERQRLRHLRRRGREAGGHTI